MPMPLIRPSMLDDFDFIWASSALPTKFSVGTPVEHKDKHWI